MIDPNALEVVIGHILDGISSRKGEKGPFILGLSGLQGSGKSTWATAIAQALTQRGIPAATISLDDLYHNHDSLAALRVSYPDNKLLHQRGQPGTHDEVLAQTFFTSLHNSNDDVFLPSFDKSKFNGEGDRRPREEWKRIDSADRPQVFVFEGWCLGFQPLEPDEVRTKWRSAREQLASEPGSDITAGQKSGLVLGEHELEHLLAINDNLRRYCDAFMGPQHFDALVFLDTDRLENVYQWRLDQERALKQATGEGMTDEEVIRFVKRYMPSYELYLEQLQTGRFFSQHDKQQWKKLIKVILGVDRSVLGIQSS